jgi:large subunit ribosomal protein L35
MTNYKAFGRACLDACCVNLNYKEYEMPKMKTNSGAKKRFRFTASGKVKAGQAGKRHGMVKRSQTMIRNARGTQVLKDCDSHHIYKMMPYA